MSGAQEVHGEVGQQVGRIALVLGPHAVDVQRRVGVRTLAPKRHPVLEPRPRVVAGAAHVPFAHEGGLVSGGLQPDRERRQIRGHRGAVVEHLVGVRIETRQDRRTARRAERRGDECVLEQDALLGQAVEVRRLEVRVAHTKPVEPLIVGEDEDDVARPGLILGGGGRGGEQAAEQVSDNGESVAADHLPNDIKRWAGQDGRPTPRPGMTGRCDRSQG